MIRARQGVLLVILMAPIYLMAATSISLEQINFESLLKTHPIDIPGIDNKVHLKGNSLIIRKKRSDNNNVNHFRVQQLYQGIPVFGAQGVIHSKQNLSGMMSAIKIENQSSLTGKVFDHLENDLEQVESVYEKNSLEALDSYKKRYRGQSFLSEAIEPIIFIDDQQVAHWAFKVQLTFNQDDDIPKKPTAIIDARTFRIFVQWNEIKTIQQVKGLGFGGNHKTTKYQYGLDRPALNITRDNDLQKCFLNNDIVQVVDMKHEKNRSKHPVSFSCPFADVSDNHSFWTGNANDGYDMVNGAYSPTNDALYIGEMISGLYKDWFGVYALTKHNKAMKIIMRVHYGYYYENAFWDGEQMTFGDGAEIFHPLVSLGIGAHEVSHGFTEQHSDLLYYGQSGAINESFSDMAAQAAEFYASKENSWLIGAGVTKSHLSMKALRYMEKPSQDGVSIDTAFQYRSGMDVHHASGVYNRFFYLLATTPNWDTKKAFQVVVKANMDYWTSGESFISGACGVLNATRDLGYTIDDVQNAFEQVEIHTDECINHSIT